MTPFRIGTHTTHDRTLWIIEWVASEKSTLASTIRILILFLVGFGRDHDCRQDFRSNRITQQLVGLLFLRPHKREKWLENGPIFVGTQVIIDPSSSLGMTANNEDPK